jgi:hypothetical protein
MQDSDSKQIQYTRIIKSVLLVSSQNQSLAAILGLAMNVILDLLLKGSFLASVRDGYPNANP